MPLALNQRGETAELRPRRRAPVIREPGPAAVPRSKGVGDTHAMHLGRHGRVRCPVVCVGPAVVLVRHPDGYTVTLPRESQPPGPVHRGERMRYNGVKKARPRGKSAKKGATP